MSPKFHLFALLLILLSAIGFGFGANLLKNSGKIWQSNFVFALAVIFALLLLFYSEIMKYFGWA